MEYWELIIQYGLLAGMAIAIIFFASGKIWSRKIVDTYFSAIQKNSNDRINAICETFKTTTERVCSSFEDTSRKLIKNNEIHAKALKEVIKILKKNGSSVK